MSVVIVGLNHRTVPLPVLERMTVSSSRLPKALHDLRGRRHLAEAVLLSTCARTEIYVEADKFHGALQSVRDFLAEESFTAPEDFADHLYDFYGEAAARHLFRVASGVDSAVLGEGEILGQVGRAAESARAEGTAGAVLSSLFRHAVLVGKRARSETAIARGVTSISQAAVALAERTIGSLAGRTVLVLGAGDSGEGIAQALKENGGASVRVANRTASRAAEVAGRVGAVPVGVADIGQHLAEVDVLLTSTSSDSYVLTVDDLVEVTAERRGRPLLIVDVAVPRDVEPAAEALEGITLLDMNDIADFARLGREARAGEVRSVEAIIEEEVVRHIAATATREVAPLVASLHDRAEAVRVAELVRFRSRLAGLDDKDRAAVEALTRGIVAKLLHDPTVGLKNAAGTAQGDRLSDAVRDLFRL
ncbi:MAG: glutamyl-tRNA reductase [Acidimicrobiales bacterium]